MIDLSPGLLLIIGALLVPTLRGRVRAVYMLALPAVIFAYTLTLPHGAHGALEFLGMPLVTLRVDGLSLIFAYAFLLAAMLGVIYSLHVKDAVQQTASLAYAGSAVGAAFAGDLVTLFAYWEGTAIASVFLIWARRSERSYAAGMRYLLIQVLSGLLLFFGVLLHYRTTGSIAFDSLDAETPAGLLIFLSFGIKCAFPLLHTWLKDAYPEATITGTVWLSAFTTKLAIYAMARGFAGTEILIPIGAVMAIFPVFYATLENELRRLLAYSLNSQLGFMVAGVGIGTELSVNGAAAHAFCSVLYQGLLFMAAGAVMLRTGTARLSDLGGLFRSMPWTAAFCIAGAASIASLPLFNGFVSKAMIVTAAMEEGHFAAWLALLAAGAAVLVHTALKAPYFVFFAEPRGKAQAPSGGEAPGNMLVAMGIAAALCLAIGIAPGAFYALLPNDIDYHAFTLEHVVTQLQIIMFGSLAFVLLLRKGLFPARTPAIWLDVDWLYRRAGQAALAGVWNAGCKSCEAVSRLANRSIEKFLAKLYKHHGPQGILARSWPTGSMAFWTTLLLGAYLLFYYY